MTSAPEWFATKFKLAELTVRRFAFWTWSVRPTQCTPGASVLSLNRPCPAWGEVTAEENAELAIVVAEMEGRLKAVCDYDKINYLMLMMVDPQVHFHVIPRYAKPKGLFGVEWIDRAWPKPPDLSAGTSDLAVAEAVRLALTTA
ncbi:MAG TPA: hypothetical protein VN634_17660 [Candidatus Limnocylindrales bacterium]|nr:hypothetical protein [Candidatus Limnocylindrales bacterium]